MSFSSRNSGTEKVAPPSARVVIVIALVLAAFLALFLFYAYDRVRFISDSWHTQSEVELQKVSALSSLHSSLGYEGFIHNFKDYVLSQDTAYLRAAENDTTTALGVVDRLLELASTTREKEALLRIKEIIKDYQLRLFTARDAVTSGLNVEETDALVRLNDTLASAELGLLVDEIMTQGDSMVAVTEAAMSDTIRLLFWGVLGIPIICVVAFYFIRYLYRIDEMQAEVARQSERLELTFDNINQGICLVDADLSIQVVNDRYYEILELTKEQVKPGTNLRDVFKILAERGDYGTGDVRKMVEDRVNQALEFMPLTIQRVRPDGKTIEFTGIPIQGGGYVATYSDITDRVRAEKAADDARARLEDAIAVMNEGFVYYDAGDRLVLCNDKYRDYYPKSADLFVPGTPFEYILKKGLERGEYDVAPEMHEEWLRERLASHMRAEEVIEQKLGDGRWLKIAERRTPEGGTVGFRVDITDLKKAQEKAEAASRAKSAFVANISHEIRTPMNAIIGLTGLAMKTNTEERTQKYLEDVYASATSLLGIINDVLDFSRLETGKIELEHVPFKLADVFDRVARNVAEAARKKGLNVLLSIDPDAPQGYNGDPLRLGQILTNFASNAVKFTDNGNIILRCDCHHVFGNRARLVFSVSDTGIGISPDQKSRLFQPFSQADSSTTRLYGGSGLGLVISKELADVMSGILQVESEPGIGSTFSMEITLQPTDSPVPWKSRYRALATSNVLVVHPSDVTRQMIGNSLSQVGVGDVRCFASLPDAGTAFENAPELGAHLDAIICDHSILDDGFAAFLRSVASGGAEPGAPRIIVIGDGKDMNQIDPSVILNVHDYVTAPLKSYDLIASVTELLEPNDKPAHDATPDRRPAIDEDMSELMGLHVLVVEDNELNQKVVAGLLQQAGVTFEIADNGAAAIKALDTNDGSIDLVLMDVQMPIMDGLEATKRIRKQQAYSDTPIVAMTAHVMAAERTACFHAGMNDHLAKPLVPDALYEVLLRWKRQRQDPMGELSALEPRDSSSLDGTRSSSTPAGFPNKIGPVDLSRAKKMLAGNDTLLFELISDFKDKYSDFEARLKHLLDEREMAEASRLVHTVASLAGTLGAYHLMETARVLEHQLDAEGSEYDLSAVFVDFAEAMSAFQLISSSTNKEIDVPTDENVDSSQIRPLIFELEECLLNNRWSASEIFPKLQTALGNSSRSDLETLGASMKSFDFDQALIALRRIKSKFGLEEHPNS